MKARFSSYFVIVVLSLIFYLQQNNNYSSSIVSAEPSNNKNTQIEKKDNKNAFSTDEDDVNEITDNTELTSDNKKVKVKKYSIKNPYFIAALCLGALVLVLVSYFGFRYYKGDASSSAAPGDETDNKKKPDESKPEEEKDNSKKTK